MSWACMYVIELCVFLQIYWIFKASKDIARDERLKKR